MPDSACGSRPRNSGLRVLALCLLLALLGLSTVAARVEQRGAGVASAESSALSATYVPVRTPVADSLYPYPEQRVGIVNWRSDLPIHLLHAGFMKLAQRGPTAAERQLGLDSCTVILEDTMTWELPDPTTYWSGIERMVLANPGHLWFIGNEPDNPCRFGTYSAEYAERYYKLYHFVKDLDPSAQVGIGGIVRPSEIRHAWLERVLDEYQRRYGEPMPVDVWNIHNLLLSECPGECGCPEGNSCGGLCCSGGYVPEEFWCASGRFIPQDEQDRVDLFEQFIWDFRRWMATREEARDKPLIVTEIGVLTGVEADDFAHERINQFMARVFDFMINERDADIGYAADGHRLVQRFTWYSTHDWKFNGFLFDTRGRLTDFGLNFANYTARFVPVSPIEIFFQRGWTGYTEDNDTTIRPAESGPAGYNLWLSADGQQKVLLQFDLSVLPSDVEVLSAELSLYTTSHLGAEGMAVGCFGIRRPWDVQDASWLQATAATRWEVPGCGGASDRDAEAVSTVVLMADNSTHIWDVTGLAQEWVSDPSANHGVLLEGDAAGTGHWIFLSSDQPERPPQGLHRRRPKLKLVVSLPQTMVTETATPPQGTATHTATQTTALPTLTASQTATLSPTGTLDPTQSGTRTVTPTGTLTATRTITSTATLTVSPAATHTPTCTMTSTASGAPDVADLRLYLPVVVKRP